MQKHIGWLGSQGRLSSLPGRCATTWIRYVLHVESNHWLNVRQKVLCVAKHGILSCLMNQISQSFVPIFSSLMPTSVDLRIQIIQINYMKQLLLTYLLAFVLGISMLIGQQTQGFTYQAIARGLDGQVLPNRSNLSVSFTIHLGSATGPEIFRETHTATTNQFGLFSLEIGAIESFMFANIDWGQDRYFLSVEVDGNLLGSQELLAVPYSKVSNTATNMELANLIDVDDAEPKDNHVLKWNGNSWGPAEDQGGIGSQLWNRSGTNIHYSTGNVGIGVNVPRADLDVDGDIIARNQLDIGNPNSAKIRNLINADGSGIIEVYGGDNNKKIELLDRLDAGFIRGYGSNGAFNFTFGEVSGYPNHGFVGVYGANGNIMDPAADLEAGILIDSDGLGRVFGDEIHGQVIHVSRGNKYWEITSSTSSNLQFHLGNVYKAQINSVNGAFQNVSDIRLKRDIEPLGPVLSRVLKLNPASYYFKDSQDLSKRSMGFIAQEVEAVFPELVYQSEKFKYLSYSEFAVIAIKAIQEQQTQIEEQKEKLEAHEKSILELKAELEALKRAVLK